MKAKKFLKRRKKILRKKRALERRIDVLSEELDLTIKKLREKSWENTKPLMAALRGLEESLKKFQEKSCPQKRQHRFGRKCGFCKWFDVDPLVDWGVG